MKILVTNDDGIDAPGLLALAKAMKSIGDVNVIAPDKNWSISGHSKTVRKPIQAKVTNLNKDIPALAIDGTPTDCVILAHLGLMEKPIDLVVSGINPYANMGSDLTYSGTVTAAMEAIVWGIPAIAFSLNGAPSKLDSLNYDTAGMVAQEVVKNVLKKGLSKDILLNVNVPNVTKNAIKGYKITKQGKRIYLDQVITRKDEHGKPYHWIVGDPPIGIPEEGTDIGAISEDYVSITPVDLDLTSHKEIDHLKTWRW